MARLKMKNLEEFLQGLDGFENPKVQLEQYCTPAHIASCVLYNIQVKIFYWSLNLEKYFISRIL